MWRKNRPYGVYNRYKLYEQGIDKFTKEFDAEYYSKSLRNLKILVASLMDNNERFISSFQQYNALSLQNIDCESDSEDEATKDMPKYLHKEDHAEQHHENIIEFLKNYLQEEHSAKDLKLLKGTYTRKNFENHELKKYGPDRHDSHEEAADVGEELKNNADVDNGFDSQNEQNYSDGKYAPYVHSINHGRSPSRQYLGK